MLNLCQVALSALDLDRTHGWYRRVLGFRTAGARRHREGADFAAVAGLPDASFDVWCLVGEQNFVQIEAFQFSRPDPRPAGDTSQLPAIGYTGIGIRTASLDQTLERAERDDPAAAISVGDWHGRRAATIEDPDGVAIHLVEDAVPAGSNGNPGGTAPVIESVSMCVPSIDRALEFWVGGLGWHRSDGEDESPTDCRGDSATVTATRRATLRDSAGVALHLAEFSPDVARPRPAGYRISDQGILNVAVGSTDAQKFGDAYARLSRLGYRTYTAPWTVPGIATVAYTDDPERFCVELLHVEEASLEYMGFIAESTPESKTASESAYS